MPPTRIPCLCILLTAASAHADAPQYRWAVGQRFTYKMSQVTRVTQSETRDGRAVASTVTIKVAMTKTWRVTAVAAGGTATAELSVDAIRVTRREGDKPAETVVDSTAAADKPTVKIQIQPDGTVLKAERTDGQPSGRLIAEPPFRFAPPAGPVTEGSTWEQKFALKLDPPYGVGEQYGGVRKFTYKSLAKGVLTCNVETGFASLPEEANERVPLLPLLSTGKVYFDPANGHYLGADLTVNQKLAEYRGPGTRYHFESRLVERLEKTSR